MDIELCCSTEKAFWKPDVWISDGNASNRIFKLVLVFHSVTCFVSQISNVWLFGLIPEPFYLFSTLRSFRSPPAICSKIGEVELRKL